MQRSSNITQKYDYACRNVVRAVSTECLPQTQLILEYNLNQRPEAACRFDQDRVKAP